MEHHIAQTRPTWLPTWNTHAALEKNIIKVVTERHRRHSSPSKRFRLHFQRPPTKPLPQPMQKTMSAYANQSTKTSRKRQLRLQRRASPKKVAHLAPTESGGHCRKSGIVASLLAPRHAAPTSQLHSGTQHRQSVTKDMPRLGSAHHLHRCHTARNATKAPKTSSAAANHDVV